MKPEIIKLGCKAAVRLAMRWQKRHHQHLAGTQMMFIFVLYWDGCKIINYKPQATPTSSDLIKMPSLKG